MRVTLVQSDLRTDAAALRVARALRRRNHEVTLVVPQFQDLAFTPESASRWQAEGFPWIPVGSARLAPPRAHFPRDPGLAAARTISGVVEAFDAAWFFERHWAMPALRDRKFRDQLLPLVVLDARPDLDPIPASLEQINRSSAEAYALRWADAVLGSEADKIEGSIRRLEEMWQERRLEPARPIGKPGTTPAVTVCIPHFESPDSLPETLESLVGQTTNDFTVVVVDDGSHTAKAREAFDGAAAKYANRGWRFVRQENQFPGAARNRAAREAASEYLLFLDADDIAMPTMVERFLRAALLTGGDCLVAPNYGFRDDPEGPCALLYDPPGSLIGSIADDMHGGSCFLVRRAAFWSVGGFTEIRGIGFEDYEFHVRCHLAGLNWDVLPELIYRYRMPGTGNVSRSTDGYANQARVLALYEDRLRGSGLRQLPLALASAFWRLEHASDQAEQMRAVVRKRTAASRKPRELRLLFLACYFPFGLMSGGHRRVQEMIRYFGSRHRLTLITSMRREQLAPARKEAFRYLEAVWGVEGSSRSAAQDANLPARVRQVYTDNMQAALHTLPTDQYHATLVDMIFMAEFRRDINSVKVLTEHNIESRLLRQAAGRSWRSTPPDGWQNATEEAVRLEKYEDRVWPEFPLRAVCSEADRACMDGRVKRGKTVVAPNGADPSIWLPRARRETATVLFPAHLGYPPNVDAVEFLLSEIWPKVRRRNAGARLILAGREPAEEVKSAAEGVPGLEIYPNPESMDQVARRASIMAVPLRLGSGTRLKILESMAWGLPVVSTTLGAEGIDAEDGEHLLIRDDPDSFGDAILRLMVDDPLWQKLRNRGRELVRERYAWDRVFKPLESALLELL